MDISGLFVNRIAVVRIAIRSFVLGAASKE
jgi:hypothetical protein